jgi:DNA-binding beta-propeller fold protein YncE
VLDAPTLKTLAVVRVGKMPHNVQVSPDGRFAWVTNNGEFGPSSNASAHKGMAHDTH